MPRKRKRFRSKTKPSSRLFSFTLTAYFLVGILLITSSVAWKLYRARVLSFTGHTPAASTTIASTTPQLLSIPDLQISISITPAVINNGVWEISEAGVSHLTSSATPGTAGNIVIYGHNKKSILSDLKQARVGQIIYIVTSDKIVHAYEISGIKTVSPSQIDVIAPTQEEVLTLYTCTGFLDSKRLVVRARPRN